MNDKYTSEEVRLEAERCGSGADSCDYDPVKNGMLTAYAERIEADERDLECAQRIPEPIPMLLFCPKCHTQHIDKPETVMQRYHAADLGKPLTIWDNPPHRSHLCHSCGCIWRPADVPTTGVARIETRGKSDNYDGSAKPPASPKSLERAAVEELLTAIAEWRLPATGLFWSNGEPMSYGACYGSNGERDYMRRLARTALEFLGYEGDKQ